MPQATKDVAAVGAGAISTQYITNERPLDLHQSLFESYPELTPMTVLLTKLGDIGATQEQLWWMEEKEMPFVYQLSAAAAAGATTIYLVANGDTIQKNTYLYNVDKDDICLCGANGTSNTLTSITKGSGGTTDVAWEVGDILYSLLPAETEGSTEYTNVHGVAMESGYNYQQLVRLQFGMTRMADGVSTHFGGAGWKRARLRQLKYRQARIMWELNTAWGGRASSSSGTSALRLAGGLRFFLDGGSNYKDFNGYFTESAFNNWISNIVDLNNTSGSLIFLAARNVIRKFSEWGLPNVELSPRSTEYGLRIKTYIGPDVDIDLVPMPLFTEGAARGMGYILDPSRVKMKVMDSMKLHEDLLGFQTEVIYDMYRQISSLMVADEKYHAMCVNALI